jgi:hypothetical protein
MFRREFLINYLDCYGIDKLVEFCNMENKRGRTFLEEFIQEKYETCDPDTRDKLIYDLLVNCETNVDHFSKQDGISTIELLKCINYNFSKLKWIKTNNVERYKSLIDHM